MSPGRRLLSIAVLVGGLLGAFSMLADGIIPSARDPWEHCLSVGACRLLVRTGYEVTEAGRRCRRADLGGGITTYYLGTAIRGYVLGEANLVWTAVALAAGPVMGLSGAAITSRLARPPVAAVVAPAAMLVAKAIFLAFGPRVWRWNLSVEPYRLIDLGIIVALFLGGIPLAA